VCTLTLPSTAWCIPTSGRSRHSAKQIRCCMPLTFPPCIGFASVLVSPGSASSAFVASWRATMRPNPSVKGTSRRRAAPYVER